MIETQRTKESLAHRIPLSSRLRVQLTCSLNIALNPVALLMAFAQACKARAVSLISEQSLKPKSFRIICLNTQAKEETPAKVVLAS